MTKQSYRLTFNSSHSNSTFASDFTIDMNPLYQELRGKKCKVFLQSHIFEIPLTNDGTYYLNADFGQSNSIQTNSGNSAINNSKAVILLDTLQDSKRLFFRDNNFTCPIITNNFPQTLRCFYTSTTGQFVGDDDINQAVSIQFYIECEDEEKYHK